MLAGLAMKLWIVAADDVAAPGGLHASIVKSRAASASCRYIDDLRLRTAGAYHPPVSTFEPVQQVSLGAGSPQGRTPRTSAGGGVQCVPSTARGTTANLNRARRPECKISVLRCVDRYEDVVKKIATGRPVDARDRHQRRRVRKHRPLC